MSVLKIYGEDSNYINFIVKRLSDTVYGSDT